MRYADHYCECEEKYEPEHTYTFTGQCVVTQKTVSVTVKAPDLFKYRQGESIQFAFPYLSAADREFLMTGMSGEGFDIMFPDDDDDDEDEDEDDV